MLYDLTKIDKYTEQVRALLGRDESELADDLILLDVYSGKAVRDALRASGLDLDTMTEAERPLFENLVEYNAAVLLIPHCMTSEATLQQTANAKVQFEATDWTALRAALLEGVRGLLEELDEAEDAGAGRYFMLAGPGRG